MFIVWWFVKCKGAVSYMGKKKLPIGIEFFSDFTRDNFYYVI